MYDYRLFDIIKRVIEALAREGIREPGSGIIEYEICGLPVYVDLDKATIYPRLSKKQLQ